ncbi:MAG TPA: dTDP-4-dehydrorhamnose 3,5-epimerase [Blastocatellia bacterium]|nr:dTDP-4-dehydrorhamnose 3,5-epimerase [Blastocatellia bacterium]
MRRIETAIPGLWLIEPTVFEDSRGFFFESYHQEKFARLGINTTFVQDNHARSSRGTLRGLHYQIKRPQAKLCRVISGEVLDVAVDIRRGSPYFGRHVGVKLSSVNRLQIYIPEGFAHGYLVLSETAEFVYKCSDFYFEEHDRGIAWNDPQLRIDWGIDTPTLSAKDTHNPPLADVDVINLPEY